MNEQEAIISQEVADRATAIPVEEIEQRLFEFSQTEYWPLVVRYSSDRINVMKERLAIIDPQKDLVNLCRSQGIIVGLLDILQAIKIIEEGKKASAEEKKEKKGKS